MKFSSTLDVQTFLIEIKCFDKLSTVDESYKPTDEELSSFIKNRSPLVGKLKNYRKSANSKANWRENRTKMMKGIKAFHRSTDGKRFHKRLGRFLATRLFRSKETNESAYEGLLTKQGYLKGLASAKQHLLVELEYFHQIQEQVELEEFLVDYAFPYFHRIEEKIISGNDLSEDEESFLFDISDTNAVMQKVSEIYKKEFAEIENLWNSISSDLNKAGIAISATEYYPMLIEKLKETLGTTNE
jgi:hypothetical protein